MRGKIKNYPLAYSKRVVRVFLWWPRKLRFLDSRKVQWRWLEMANIVQIYREGWKDYYWEM